MILPFHIIVALLSLVLSSYAFLWPSLLKLRFAYGLVGLTLASGTYLVVSSPAHIMSTCISGLVYISLVSSGLVAARAKLASQNSTD